jgi:hypothetical protein
LFVYLFLPIEEMKKVAKIISSIRDREASRRLEEALKTVEMEQ